MTHTRFFDGEELAAVPAVRGTLRRGKHRLLGAADHAALRSLAAAGARAADLRELAALHLARHDAALRVRADEVALVRDGTVRAHRPSRRVEASALAQVAGVGCGPVRVGPLLLLLPCRHRLARVGPRVLRAVRVGPATRRGTEGGATAAGAATAR